MLTAFVLMIGNGRVASRYNLKITNSKIFEQIRIDYAKYISENLTGRTISQETRNKLAKIAIGRKYSEKVNKSKGRKGKPGPIHTEEVRAKIGIRTRGKTFEELYGEEKAAELKKKIANAGEKNGFYGKSHSEETRFKFKAYHDDPKTKKFKSELVKGDKNPAKRPEVKEKIGQSQRERLAKQKLLGVGHYNSELMAKRKELSQGSNNGNAKTFRFTDPNGIVTNVTGGSKKFFKDHGLSYDNFIRNKKNNIYQRNGWTIQVIDESQIDIKDNNVTH
jgi:hypothetical protein